MRADLILALTLFTIPACAPDEDAPAGDADTFEADENDDTVGALPEGKADGRNSIYRSGCGDAIRQGKYALKGDLVTPTGVVKAHYLVIDGEKISAVSATAPAGVTLIDTGGIIFPRLLHRQWNAEENPRPIAELRKRY